MPQSFFDSADDATALRDEEGADCADAGAARPLAVRALLEMMIEGNSDTERRTATIRVRDARGEGVYAATLRLDVHGLP